jgi:hypothetical protein
VYLRTNEDLDDTFTTLRRCYEIVTAMTLIIIGLYIWNICAFTVKRRLLCQAWFWVDLLVIVGLIVSLGIALKKFLVNEETVDLVEHMIINQYMNFQALAYWSQVETASFSVCQWWCFLKMWRILIHIDESFRITTLTLSVSLRFLQAYGLFLLIMLVAFASSGHFIFGVEMREFRTFVSSLLSLIAQVL